MAAVSAGILLYRRTPGLEVFIGHMGGPFWARKAAGAWSIPKGLVDPDEDLLAAALREFAEEVGVAAPDADYAELGRFRYASGKLIVVFAAESDFEVEAVNSNTFELEWPPRSGRMQSFPEIDAAGWYPVAEAREMLVSGQVPALAALDA